MNALVSRDFWPRKLISFMVNNGFMTLLVLSGSILPFTLDSAFIASFIRVEGVIKLRKFFWISSVSFRLLDLPVF